MKLGILVNTDRHFEDIRGLTEAAVSKGNEVRIFVMDEGTKLLENPALSKLCELPGVSISYCSHNANQLQVKIRDVCDQMVCGSQFENACMDNESDKVIVL